MILNTISAKPTLFEEKNIIFCWFGCKKLLLDWFVFACFFPIYCKSAAVLFIFLLCVTCRNLILALFLVPCHCVILSIWSLQMRTSIRALTMSMTKLLHVLSAKFSRSNPLCSCYVFNWRLISRFVESIT